MVAVRERIRLNGAPLAEDKFAKYFFEVWDRFERNTQVSLLHLHRSESA
jgi:folylpolyglutamate synthase